MLRPVATRREAGIGYRQIYLQRPGTTSAADLGEKDLDVRPIRYGRAQFEHDVRTEVGQIERIDPADCETTERFQRCWWCSGGDENGATTSVIAYATCKGSPMVKGDQMLAPTTRSPMPAS